MKIVFGKLDKLDAERVNYMISAENYAGRPPSNGTYVWSPSLKKAGCTITYWKLRLYGVHGGVEDLDNISRLQADLRLHDKGCGDKLYIKLKFSKAWQELRKVQKGSMARRDSHMDTLAQRYIVERQTTKTIEITKIQQTEHMQQTAAKHKWYLR